MHPADVIPGGPRGGWGCSVGAPLGGPRLQVGPGAPGGLGVGVGAGEASVVLPSRPLPDGAALKSGLSGSGGAAGPLGGFGRGWRVRLPLVCLGDSGVTSGRPVVRAPQLLFIWLLLPRIVYNPRFIFVCCLLSHIQLTSNPTWL